MDTSNGWRLACCWPRIRKVLLIDEPVAGMNHAEMERTADAADPLGGRAHRGRGRTRHGVRAQHSREGDSSSRRQRAGRRRDGQDSKRSAGHRGLSGCLTCLQSAISTSTTAKATPSGTPALTVPAGRLHLPDGAQRRGQDDLTRRCIMGLAARACGTRRIRWRKSSGPRAPEIRARAGHRLRAARPRDLPAAHRRGEPAHRPAPAARRAARTRKDRGPHRSSASSSCFPCCKKMLGRRGGDLSGGQQQQLAIGRALAINPKLLILDEPTEGIQPNVVHDIGDVIMRLNQEAGIAVLLVEQKLPFARRVASQLLHHGPRANRRRRRHGRPQRRVGAATPDSVGRVRHSLARVPASACGESKR